MTTIEWTDETWNPTVGCTRVSPGCDRCYAITSSRIRSANPHPTIAAAHAGATEVRAGRLDWTGQVNLVEDRLTKPLTWRKPRRVFVDSMSDLFHDQVPDDYIARVFAVMAATPRHTYQLLTKRHGRMRSLLTSSSFRGAIGSAIADLELPVPGQRAALITGQEADAATSAWPLANVWLGVSVEDQQRADLRIPALLDTPAAVRFLSCEPLLGPVDLSLWLDCAHDSESGDEGQVALLGRMPRRWRCDHCASVRQELTSGPDDGTTGWRRPGLGWVIVGGETGSGARPMHPDWPRQLRDQCALADVPFFFKQWGAWGPAPWVVRVCDPEVGWQGTDAELVAAKLDAEARGATHAIMSGGHLHEPSHRPWSLDRTSLPSHTEPIRRWGKKAAGRELDGRTHDDFPLQEAARA